MTLTLHADRCTFMIISHSVLVRIRNISDKHRTEIKIQIFCSTPFFPKIVPFNEKIWKNIVQQTRPAVTYMAHVRCMQITKVRHTLRLCNAYHFKVLMPDGGCIIWQYQYFIAQELKIYHLNEIMFGVINENEHGTY